MKVLIIGSGGREHALGSKIAQSSLIEKLYFAPGNPGTSRLGENLELDPSDTEALKRSLKELDIKYLVIGPEDPIVGGLKDELEADPELSELTVIAPDKAAARLEGSKAFAKAFMERHGIPTASYKAFKKEEREEAHAFLDSIDPPYVIKADGLAAGKGVSVHEDKESARKALDEVLKEGKFGAAGEEVVIEEYLDGIELSVFILCDGGSYKILPEAKDYKRVGEGDEGPNTGGMGAVSPVPFLDKVLLEKIEDRVIRPTVQGIEAEGMRYQGFLFFGLMIVGNDPYVVEYNVRMGDPEAQVVMPRIASDLLDLFEGVGTGTLSEKDLEIDPRSATAVVLASEGYPGKYQKGKRIKGSEDSKGVETYLAGVSEKNGELVTSGGRVLAVTGLGGDLETALERTMKELEKIHFDGMHYRRDIGKDLLKKKAKA